MAVESIYDGPTRGQGGRTPSSRVILELGSGPGGTASSADLAPNCGWNHRR